MTVFEIFDDGTGPALHAGGWFTEVGTVPARGVAKWNGNDWSALAGPGGPLNWAAFESLAVFDSGQGRELWGQGYANVGGVSSDLVIWDGSNSYHSPHPNAGLMMRLAVLKDQSGTAVYVGGAFRSWGNSEANGIVKWDGSSWSVLSGPHGTGVNGSVWALGAFDDGSGPAIYVGGVFSTAGGLTANNIAKWDGTGWSPLSGPFGNGVDYKVSALVAHRDSKGSALYAGGEFHKAGGLPANNVAKWDGHQWSALDGPSGNGVDGGVRVLASLDDGTGSQLYAGGSFLSAGGEKVNRIARWSGFAWSSLAGPFGAGVSNPVEAIAAFDDGSGMAIYAGGSFASAGGIASRKVARWSCRRQCLLRRAGKRRPHGLEPSFARDAPSTRSVDLRRQSTPAPEVAFPRVRGRCDDRGACRRVSFAAFPDPPCRHPRESLSPP